jgi:hypothetical protein
VIILVKCNYFENLEKLSSLSLSAVTIACEEGNGRQDIKDIRKECDRLVCDTEDALFSDFLPPLERESIAAIAHCLSRVTDRSAELISEPSATPYFMKANSEAAVCVRLACELHRGILMLKRIKKPSECPDLCGYRELLSEGRRAHRQMLCAVRSGTVPRRHAEAIILTGRLRSELSTAFDGLVEIMLNNI